MLNPVTVRAGLRGLRSLSHTSQGSHNSLHKPDSPRLTFAAAGSSPKSSSLEEASESGTRFNYSLTSHPLANSSTSTSSTASKLLGRFSARSRSNQALKEAIRQPEPVKSGFLDRRSIQLPLDKQKFSISQKVLRLLQDEEQTVQQDFRELIQEHIDHLPSPQAQALTFQALDFFNNGVSKTLRRWLLQDLNSHQPKHFTNAQGLSAGLKSYQGNLEAVDHFLNKAMQGAKEQVDAQGIEVLGSKAAQMLEKTEQDVHDYRDALNHLILKPSPITL